MISGVAAPVAGNPAATCILYRASSARASARTCEFSSGGFPGARSSMALRAYSRGWRQVGSLAGGSPAAFDRVLRPSWQAGERPPSQIQRPETRAFAKSRKSDDDEKSWSEVAEEASHTAKSVFNKLVSSVKKIAGQDEQSKLERQRRKEQEELSKPPDCMACLPPIALLVPSRLLAFLPTPPTRARPSASSSRIL